jgi:hypothetical protein
MRRTTIVNLIASRARNSQKFTLFLFGANCQCCRLPVILTEYEITYLDHILHHSVEIFPEIRHFIWKSGSRCAFMFFAGFSPHCFELSTKGQYREWSESVDYSYWAVDLTTEKSWFVFRYEAGGIFFWERSITLVGPAKPPIKWALGVFLRRYTGGKGSQLLISI